MAAFTEKRMNAMNKRLEVISQALVTKTAYVMPRDKVFALLTRPEHREILMETHKIVGAMTRAQQVETILPTPDAREINVTFLFDYYNPYPYPLPQYAKKELQLDALDNAEGFVSWAQKQYEVRSDLVLTRELLAFLNARYRSPEQVRFFFPGVLHLMTDDDLFGKMRVKLATPQFPECTRPPVEVAEHAKKATALLGRLGMLVSGDAADIGKQNIRVILNADNTVHVPWIRNKISRLDV